MADRIIEVTRRGRKGEDGDPGATALAAITTGGSSTVYTVTNASPQLSYSDGYGVTIKAHATNGATPTANIDTLGAKSIKKYSGGSVVAIAAGDMVINQFYVLHYSSDADALLLFGRDLALGAQMTPRAAPAHSEGLFYYDQDIKSFVFFNDQSASSLTVGREMWARVVNKTGVQIDDGAVVYISGSQGNTPTIALADRDVEANSRLIGLATHDIANDAEGEVTIAGIVRGIDTSAFSEGDPVYLSSTAGAYATAVGGAGKYDVKIGVVLNTHATQGQIRVHPERIARATTAAAGLALKATLGQAQGGVTGDVFMDDVLTKAAIEATTIGEGQTWQDVSGSRAVATSYQNTTGRPIMVSFGNNSVVTWAAEASSDDATWVVVANGDTAGGSQENVSFIVPDTWYYRITGAPTIKMWSELR